MKEWIRSIFKTLWYTFAHTVIILVLKLMKGSHFQTSFPHLKVQKHSKESILKEKRGFPGGAVVENLPANAGDMGSSPGLGRSHMPRSN